MNPTRSSRESRLLATQFITSSIFILQTILISFTKFTLKNSRPNYIETTVILYTYTILIYSGLVKGLRIITTVQCMYKHFLHDSKSSTFLLSKRFTFPMSIPSSNTTLSTYVCTFSATSSLGMEIFILSK